MARNWLGNKTITREDRYTSKSKYTEADIRWEQFKIVIWLLSGYAFFQFIIMGWTL